MKYIRERQRHNKQVNYTQESYFLQGKKKEKRRATLRGWGGGGGGIRTHDTLQSRRALYQHPLA